MPRGRGGRGECIAAPLHCSVFKFDTVGRDQCRVPHHSTLRSRFSLHISNASTSTSLPSISRRPRLTTIRLANGSGGCRHRLSFPDDDGDNSAEEEEDDTPLNGLSFAELLEEADGDPRAPGSIIGLHGLVPSPMMDTDEGPDPSTGFGGRHVFQQTHAHTHFGASVFRGGDRDPEHGPPQQLQLQDRAPLHPYGTAQPPWRGPGTGLYGEHGGGAPPARLCFDDEDAAMDSSFEAAERTRGRPMGPAGGHGGMHMTMGDEMESE